MSRKTKIPVEITTDYGFQIIYMTVKRYIKHLQEEQLKKQEEGKINKEKGS